MSFEYSTASRIQHREGAVDTKGKKHETAVSSRHQGILRPMLGGE